MAEEKADETAEQVETTGGNGGRLRIGGAVLLVSIVIAGIFWLRSRGKEITDDAQVDGHITQIATRVGGTVMKVIVTNNQAVEGRRRAGREIDPRDYQIAVDRAQRRARRRGGDRDGRAHRRADRAGRDAQPA